MTKYEVISLGMAIIAILISVASVCVTFYFGFLDIAKLKIKSKYLAESEDQSAHIFVHISNAGRRPVIVRMWAGEDVDGNWVGAFFGKAAEGVRLGENEWEDLRLYKSELQKFIQDSPIFFSKLWIEDSLGKRYVVPNSEIHIKQLR